MGVSHPSKATTLHFEKYAWSLVLQVAKPSRQNLTIWSYKLHFFPSSLRPMAIGQITIKPFAKDEMIDSETTEALKVRKRVLLNITPPFSRCLQIGLYQYHANGCNTIQLFTLS